MRTSLRFLEKVMVQLHTRSIFSEPHQAVDVDADEQPTELELKNEIRVRLAQAKSSIDLMCHADESKRPDHELSLQGCVEASRSQLRLLARDELHTLHELQQLQDEYMSLLHRVEQLLNAIDSGESLSAIVAIDSDVDEGAIRRLNEINRAQALNLPLWAIQYVEYLEITPRIHRAARHEEEVRRRIHAVQQAPGGWQKRVACNARLIGELLLREEHDGLVRVMETLDTEWKERFAPVSDKYAWLHNQIEALITLVHVYHHDNT